MRPGQTPNSECNNSESVSRTQRQYEHQCPSGNDSSLKNFLNITTLSTQGYGRATLKAGQEVTTFIRPGAKGEPIGLCMKIVFPDGKEIFKNPRGGYGDKE